MEEDLIIFKHLVRSFIATNVNIGKLTTVNNGTHIGHDSEIGDFCSFMVNVDISGNCVLGKKVFVDSNATIIPKKNICDSVIVCYGSIVIKNKRNANTQYSKKR